MICIAWAGFPQYAARCVKKFVEMITEKVVVVASRPVVPIQGMEELCGCDVVWINETDFRSILDIVGEIPRMLVMSGWSVPVFENYRRQVKADKGIVLGMVDLNYRVSFYAMLCNLRFRLFLRHKFDGFIVPGYSGIKVFRSYGVEDGFLRRGLYSADASLFKSQCPSSDRAKRIIYVGQFCERKNILGFCDAFCASNAAREGWTLDLYGNGPLKENLLTKGPGITVHGFVQPEQLATIYQAARVFVLPSYDEHWGLVVHEAALSGCFLLLSNVVGANDDLLGKNNGITFNPCSMSEMIDAINTTIGLSNENFNIAQEESLSKSEKISISDFGNAILSFNQQFCGR